MPQGLKIGSLLDHGKYRVEKVLGQGGFGITYLVTDLGLDKKRAVKEFFPKDYCERNETTSHVSLGTSNTTEFVERLKAKFIKEARNIANLDQHQGIIRIHTVFEENNTAYYVMDYIDGESLSAIVKRSGPIPVEKSIKYIKAVGEALEYVHSHNINHLDIKPANIMIRKKDDKPILIDFGLAKQYDSEGLQTSTTPTGISHGFAPIEQYRDGGIKEFSPQTDVYSLAATLYYLISGQVPPHATDLIESELTFRPSFPLLLQAPIRKAMSTKRHSRPKTVQQFLDTLDSLKEDENTIVAVPNRGSRKMESETRKAKAVPPKISGSGEKVMNRNERNKSPNSKRKRRYNFPAYFRKHTKQIRNWGIVIIFILVAVGISIYLYNNNKIEEPIVKEPITDDPVVPTVENLAFKSSLGFCSYTGEVDENNLPNGHGVATWETGDAKSYDGEWVHGVMEGQTTYTLNNGDTFVGTFKGDHYDQGRYTIKDDGYYFEGSFKNGQPDKGKWYDKNGKEI